MLRPFVFLIPVAMLLFNNAQAGTMQQEIFSKFVDAINAHDTNKIAALMIDDHQFIDAQGKQVSGKEQMIAGWKGYFHWFPDYKIEVTQVFVNADTVAAFGFAEGTYSGASDKKMGHWRVPASWRAVIKDKQVAVWQVFADTKIPFDILNAAQPSSGAEKRVTGIGGVFFKCKDPDKLKAWYKEHLGLNTDQYGTSFEWRVADAGKEKGFTQWSPFKETTKYFQPSEKQWMINYRVQDLERLVKQLQAEGVTITDKMETFEYGKFIHILDLEGNKVELWEPIDNDYDKIVDGRTK